jgi:CheY-like chemotaxis protein
MTPFYHPTAVLVLDDDPLFLESLDFQFSDELSCQTFTRPDAALEHLRSQAKQHPDFSRYFKDCSEMDLGSEARHGDRLLRLQLSELRSMVDDLSRHQRISVAVVDFDMPKMTGVEFCRAIADLPVKTILLTGKAGLETAISAFNEGLIDCFLQKQDANVSASLRREIKRLQHEYFADISDPIKCALALQKPCFVSDPHFVALFNEVSEMNNVVEHYVCASPPGIMMRDADGNDFFLLISDVEAVKSQCEAAERRRAPSDMVQLLRTRTAQAWFPTHEGLYHPDFEADWARYIWPAQLLPGSGSWSYSFIRHECPVEELLQGQRGLTA